MLCLLVTLRIDLSDNCFITTYFIQCIVKNRNIYYREYSSIFITATLKYKHSFLPILTTPFLVKNTFCDFKSLKIKSFKIMK